MHVYMVYIFKTQDKSHIYTSKGYWLGLHHTHAYKRPTFPRLQSKLLVLDHPIIYWGESRGVFSIRSMKGSFYKATNQQKRNKRALSRQKEIS
jgi:hypothetical protein